MKKIYSLLIFSALLAGSGCKKFLDVNTNPNGPEKVAPNLYLSPMESWMAVAPQYDARLIARYTQNYVSNAAGTTWDRHGYDPSSDNGGQLWRTAYYDFGKNLVDMMEISEAEQRWDLLGVGYVLKAWAWQQTTDLHGEIIINQAFDLTRTSYDYDSQEFAYTEIQRLLNLAITNLKRTDGAVSSTYLAKTDLIYSGDRTKWLKFAYGMLALNLNHYSNKTTYKPLDVIANVDLALASNADDALVPFGGTLNDDSNFFGPRRQNITTYRQSNFVLKMLNGTTYSGVEDPRMRRMLAPSPDGTYNGLEPNLGYGALVTAKRPNNLWGYVDVVAAGTKGSYLFDDKVKGPVMTYAQLQFVKAEAAFRMGNKELAYVAFKNGISAHIDFVNARNSDNGQLPTQITAAEKSAFLASPVIVPATSAGLTMSNIMMQKYIAQFGWGWIETWMDMRRFHYTDTYTGESTPVFVNYTIPASLYPDNGGKLAYRVRPRYNSEYVWNRTGLDAIGGLAADYHTKEMWITKP